ncbi:MAG: hypothetical protein ACRD63_11950, partial [Pyrinomonadaceae bacterium]
SLFRSLTGATILIMTGLFIACNNRGQNIPTTSASPAQSVSNNTSSSVVPSIDPDSPMASGRGKPIDTAKFDQEVVRFEKRIQSKPDDKSARSALAHAYLARANALKDAAQYRSALGDYRRTLRYDQNNSEAKLWSEQIIQIMALLKREVPPEGTEPSPLPYKP